MVCAYLIDLGHRQLDNNDSIRDYTAGFCFLWLGSAWEIALLLLFSCLVGLGVLVDFVCVLFLFVFPPFGSLLC